MNQAIVTVDKIRAAIRTLELSNRPLCVHSSLRTFGRLQGGPATVIEALLTEGCTIMVPTFTSHFDVPRPVYRRIERNGGDDIIADAATRGTHWYSPDSTEINPEMGALPQAILATDGRWRGRHPHDSFSAVGPRAAELIRDQRPLQVYAPFEALVRLDGWVALMGVGLTRMTLIHYAEQVAGRELFRRWSRDRYGAVIESQVGGCSEGFERLSGALAPLERTAEIGSSHWRAYPATEFVELAARTIRANPSITHCDDPNCRRCNDAVAGGPLGIDTLV